MKTGKKNKVINLIKTCVILFFIINNFGFTQSYPVWFLRPEDCKCNRTVVGYAEANYYPDSTFASAFNNSSLNFVKNERILVQGRQGFLTTEAGAIWMGSDIYVSFDSTRVELISKKLTIKDSFETNRLTLIVVSEKTGAFSDNDKILINLNSIPTPKWISVLPKDQTYIYASGQAPTYYYEASSWLKAEENARINLARQIVVSIKSLEKMSSTEGQTITKEKLSVVLSNIEISERWIDVKNNIVHVLAKMPGNQF